MTEAQKQAAVKVVEAISEAIEELGEVPSGHLYARLMGHMSIDTYNSIIGVLQKLGRIKVEHHLITWVKK